MKDVRNAETHFKLGEGASIPNASIPNTLALPSRADALWRASSEKELVEAVKQAVSERRDLLPLGEGSNVVLPARLDKTVVQVTDSSVTKVGTGTAGALVRVGAGKSWHSWVLESLEQSWLGLENLALIPGSVGAAPIQNIGAYGREVMEFIASVRCVDLANGELRDFSREDCKFSYRESVFKRESIDRYVVSSVVFEFGAQASVSTAYPALSDALADNAGSASAREVCDAVVALRRQKLPDPTEIPNVGSFFKNPFISVDRGEALRARHEDVPLYPVAVASLERLNAEVVKTSAAWLIDHCGLRGHRIGGAVVSKRHALVITNDHNATHSDVLALADHIQRTVNDTFSIDLEIEPRVL